MFLYTIYIDSVSKPSFLSVMKHVRYRSINFSVHLLERLMKNPDSSLKKMVEEAYNSTLKPFHGWISSAAYRV
uniref:Glycolipid transfer protein domain-containing protein n=1 Tax=Aegilops tauschii subsp. strangulata TaxID=200361 RepID=A0A453S3S2_AEGTS